MTNDERKRQRELKRVIEGCQHSLERMTEWAQNGACPICVTAELGMVRDKHAGDIERLRNLLVRCEPYLYTHGTLHAEIEAELCREH